MPQIAAPALVGLLLVGCGPRREGPHLPSGVRESSGLARSVHRDDVLWTHGDSGNPARLFAFDLAGDLVARVDVEGARAVDWEDVTSDGRGHLWIADTGNNFNVRRDLAVYRVPEPPLADGRVRVDRVVTFRYPDQTSFPARPRNFDAEAIFWADETLWLLTKHRDDLRTTLYRFPVTEGDVVLERVQDFEVGGDPARYGGMVTSADLDPTGRRLAVLTYHAIFLFERPDDGRSWLSHPVHTIPLDQDVTAQCEGIAWVGDTLVMTNEAGALMRLPEPFRTERFP